jgi:putative tricarboxylic transport membrane protein
LDFFNHIHLAFAVALEPMSIFVCFIGVFIGTLVGVLPGIGTSGAMALLLPTTFSLSPTHAIIMLAGIYYGTLYGGSTTAILLNIPGEGTSMITCLDGYPMAKNGRAGPALVVSAFGSFIAGTFSIVMLMLLAPILVSIALKFGPPEYVALIFLGLILVTYLASGSMVKALMMAAFGLLLGCIGLDIITAEPRYSLGTLKLRDGIGLIPVMMGLFGVGEVLINIEKKLKSRKIFQTKMKNFPPTKQDWKDSSLPIARGSIVGFFLGIIPGGGGLISGLFSYAMEKRLSKNRKKFGRGAIEGVAGPESANNAGGQGSFVPLLTLGIPSNVITAILIGALMLKGIQPGPLLMQEHPRLFWGVVGSMYVGNVMLVILNLPLIPLWIQILRIPYVILFPLIFLLTLIGSYTLNNSIWDPCIMIIFGVLGYLMKKFSYEPAPLIMALVLGPMFENAFRQSLIISDGSALIFFFRPVSAVFMATAIFVIFSPLFLKLFRRERPGLSDYE